MRNRVFVRALSSAAVCVLLSACAGEAPEETDLADRLGEAIREVGYACDTVVNSQAVGEDGDVWRVACGGASVYVASREAGGELCIEPTPVADPLVVPVAPAPSSPGGPLPIERLRFPAPTAELRCTASAGL